MTTRSKTSIFLQHRSNFHPYASASQQDVSSNDTIKSDLRSVKTLINKLEQIYKLPEDFDESDRGITELTSTISNKLDHIKTSIMNMKLSTKMDANRQSHLINMLQAMIHEYQTIQRRHLKNIQEQQDRQPDHFLDSGFNDEQMQLLQQRESLASQREQDIQQIHQSVHELAQIFKDLQMLVHDQEGILDRIDYNIEKTADHVVDAEVQLVEGERLQKKTGCKWMILLLIGLLVVAGILIVVIIIKK